MSTNTLEYMIKLKDAFSSAFAQAASKGKESASNILGTLVGIGAGMASMKDTVSAGFGVLTGQYSQLGNLLGALPGPIGDIGQAVGDTIGGAMEDTAKYADTVGKLSQKIGESAQWTSSFIEAADDMRVSQDSVNTSLGIFARNLGNASDAEGLALTNGKGVAGVLKEMGISANDADGKTRKLSDLLPEIADRMQELGPGTQATAYATQLFGKSGADLLPILMQGSANIRELQQASIDAGLALSDTAVKGFQDAAAASDELNDRWEAVKRQAATALLPSVTGATNALNEFFSATSEANDSTNFFERSLKTLGTNFGFWKNLIFGTSDATKEETKALDNHTASTQANSTAVQHNATTQQQLTNVANGANAAINERNAAIAQGNTLTNYNQQQIANVITAMSQQNATIAQGNGLMTAQQAAATAVALSTQTMSYASFEAQQATAALYAAYNAGTLSFSEYTAAALGVANGTLSTAQAFQVAGPAGAQFKTQMDSIEVAASGAPGKLDQVTKSIAGYGDKADGTWSKSKRLVGGLDDTEEAAGKADKKFKDTTKSLQDIPNSKSITIAINAAGLDKLSSVSTGIQALPYSKYISVTVAVYGMSQLDDLIYKLNSLSNRTVSVTAISSAGTSSFSKSDLAGASNISISNAFTLADNSKATLKVTQALRAAQRQANLAAAMGA